MPLLRPSTATKYHTQNTTISYLEESESTDDHPPDIPKKYHHHRKRIIDNITEEEFGTRFRSCIHSYWTGYGPTRRDNGQDYTLEELNEIAIKLFKTLKGALSDNGARAWLEIVESRTHSAKCIRPHNNPFSQVHICGDVLETHLLQIFARPIYSNPFQQYCKQSNTTSRCLNIFHFGQDIAIESVTQTLSLIDNQLCAETYCRNLALRINNHLTGTLYSNRAHFCKMMNAIRLKEQFNECCLIQCHDVEQLRYIRLDLIRLVKHSQLQPITHQRQVKWVCDGNHHANYYCCNVNHAVSVSTNPVPLQRSSGLFDKLHYTVLKVANCGMANKRARTTRVGAFYSDYINESLTDPSTNPIFHCLAKNEKSSLLQTRCRIDARPHNDRCMDRYHKTKSIFFHADLADKIHRSYNSFYLTFDSIIYERLNDRVYRSIDIKLHNTGQRNMYIAINDKQSNLINQFYTANSDLPGRIFRLVKPDSTYSVHCKSLAVDKYTRISTTNNTLCILSTWDYEKTELCWRSIQVPAKLISTIGTDQLYTIVRDDVPRAKCITLRLAPAIL